MLLRAPAAATSSTSGRRRSPATTRGRLLRRVVVCAVVVLLLPVPWEHRTDSDLGIAWGMDNRLVVQGQRLDPPGRYSWLTAGRPPLVAELAWQRAVRVFDDDAPPVARDMRAGSADERPVNAEPIAAGVGMAAAVEGVIRPEGAEPVDAVIGGRGPPYSWFRSLSVGSSHGLMVGLVTYAAVTEEDLTGGRHVAGTGELAADGTVGRIGGLVAKATGALRAGADVLLVPASQRHELDGLDLGHMRVIGVRSLEDAIVQLRATRDVR